MLVLIGRGLTDWLFRPESNPFYPVAHAVPALTTVDNRVVLARMKVAPDDALKDGIKFSNIFFQENIKTDQSDKQ